MACIKAQITHTGSKLAAVCLRDRAGQGEGTASRQKPAGPTGSCQRGQVTTKQMRNSRSQDLILVVAISVQTEKHTCCDLVCVGVICVLSSERRSVWWGTWLGDTLASSKAQTYLQVTFST